MAELKDRLRSLHQATKQIVSSLRERLGFSPATSRPGTELAKPVPVDPLPPLSSVRSSRLPRVRLHPFNEGPRDVVPPSGAIPAPVFAVDEQAKNTPSLAVFALGVFRVYCNEQLVIKWPSKKGKAVLKFIVSHMDSPPAKDILMDIFWPDATPEAARNNLNAAIHGLRQAFKAIRPDCRFILYEDEHYVVNPAAELWVDFEQFSKYYKRALELEKSGNINDAQSQYEKAASLYGGDYLEEDLYEDWTMLTRERLRSDYMDMLVRLSRIYFSSVQYPSCVGVCKLILSRDNCREDAHRLLMRCYSRQEQAPLALRQYHVCQQSLRDELDLAPTTATVQLYERIRRGERI